MTVLFNVFGKVEGKARPRLGRRGRVYTPAKTKHAEARVLAAWEKAGATKLHGAISAHVVAVVARPASHWLKSGALSAAGRRAPRTPTKKPDLDNVLKLVADALNGHAYEDDAQIVHAAVSRRWAIRGEDEHLEIDLKEAL